MAQQLVLLDVGGKQQFIFSTNKLTNCVGASQLIDEAGSVAVLEAVRTCGGPADLLGHSRADTRRRLKEQTLNTGRYEVIYATSGAAMVVAEDAAAATALVTEVTRGLLERAPGLEATGAFVDADIKGMDTTAVFAELHHRLAAARAARMQPVGRFPRWPFVAPCDHSGLPASEPVTSSGSERRLGREAIVKRAAADRWFDRFREMLDAAPTTTGLRTPKNAGDLEDLFEGVDWLAVVHADGNGLGKLFSQIPKQAGGDLRETLDFYRRFSLGLEEITETALRNSIGVLLDEDTGLLRALPLVLGGDDFTLLCDGRLALGFAKRYLEEFELASKGPLTDDYDELIRDALIEGVEGKRLTACAGVAIVKPHFPFTSAYELAEELTLSAKAAVRTKRAASALDFHILFDSTLSSLDAIRQEQQVDGLRLTRKPFAVSFDQRTGAWADAHDIKALIDSIRIIRAGRQRDRADNGGDALPNSQLHDIREGLFQGREAARARVVNISHRYRSLTQLLRFGSPDGDIFHPEFNDTLFLDALESEPFWQE